MKLSDCKLGTIVTKVYDKDDYDRCEIGHITGLTRVFYTGSDNKKTYYIVPLVKFANAEISIGVSLDNLEILED